MKMFLETLNKCWQCVPYLYTCKFNKMAFPWRYHLKRLIQCYSAVQTDGFLEEARCTLSNLLTVAK